MDERARARSDGTVNRGGAVFGLVTQRDLVRVIDSDRYPFSSRIRTLGAIRAKLKPEPEGIDAGLAAAKGLRTAIEKQIPGCNRWKLAQPKLISGHRCREFTERWVLRGHRLQFRTCFAARPRLFQQPHQHR